MRRIYLLLLFLIPLSLLAACSSDDEIAIATLEISKTTVDFKSEASEQSLTITTNAVAWTAQSDKSWCRPSIVGKLLKISVDQSDERLVREATVSVTADGLSKTIRVRQLGYEAAILIDQQAFEVPAVGAQIKFAVTTNVEVEPILSDWIVEAPKTRSAEMLFGTCQYIGQQKTRYYRIYRETAGGCNGKRCTGFCHRVCHPTWTQ